MGDELGKREEDSNNRQGAWADINSAFGAQIKGSFGVMDVVQNTMSADIVKAFSVSALENSVWSTALSRAYGGTFTKIAKPISPFKDMQDIMGANVAGIMNVMTPWLDTSVLGGSVKSNMFGVSAVVGFSMKRMLGPQYSFADAFAASFGTAGIANSLNSNVLQAVTKHVEFKNMMASTQWTTTIDEPLREYLADDPFPELQDLAEELGIEELDEQQQAVADEFLEARPEIAAIVTASPGYLSLSPQQRVLILGIVTIAVWLIVAVGVVYIETEVPWLKALLEDLELTPTEAANKVSAVVGGTGTLGELVRHIPSAKEPEEQPDN